MKNNQLFEVVFEENDGNFIDMISLVEVPAIEQGWEFFDKKEKEVFKKQKQGVLIGPAMIPNKILSRKEYNIVFTKDQIVKINNFWAKHNFRNNFNINHEEDKIVNGAFVSEHWIVESENDKAYDYFSRKEIPIGTLMIKVQFEDLALFEEVTNKLHGFSIEVFYNMQKVTAKTLKEIAEQNILSAEVGEDFKTYELIEEKPIDIKELRKKLEKVKFSGELVSESDVDNPVVRNVSSEDDTETGTYIRYRYDLAPEHRGEDKIIDTSRNFCRAMIEARRIYSLEDIFLMDRNGANPTIRNYSNMSIFDDAGGFNCRHTWYVGTYQLASPTEIPETFEKNGGKNKVTLYNSKRNKKIMKITKIENFKKLDQLSVEEIAKGTKVDSDNGEFKIETEKEIFMVEIKDKEIFSLEVIEEDEMKKEDEKNYQEEEIEVIDETEIAEEEVTNEEERVTRLEDAIAAMAERLQTLEELVAGSQSEEDEMEEEKEDFSKKSNNLFKELFSQYDTLRGVKKTNIKK